MTSKDHITAARVKLIAKYPFFGFLSLRLNLKSGAMFGTMATDGVSLWYDDNWISDLVAQPNGKLKLLGVITHEVLHCVWMHPTRLYGRNIDKWRYACDVVVNNYLKNNGFMLPDGFIDRPEFDGMSADEVYIRLQDDFDSQDWGQIIAPTDSSGNILDQQAIRELESQWQTAAAYALERARSAGNCPGGMEDLVKETAATIDWRTQLFNHLSSKCKNDYAWYPPHISYLSMGYHVPSLESPSLGRVVWFEDTSGSMSIDELSASRAELKELLEQMPCDELIFIEGDTKIQRETEVDDFSDVGYSVHGRGCTDFYEVFERIKELSPDVVLCFTDMQPAGWPDDPGVDVIWLRTYNIDAPFGKYVDLFRGIYD